MIRSLLNKTPYELLNGRKPKLTHLRTFRCKCYVLKNGKDRLGKFYTKSDEGIFLGYSSQSKAYKVYNKRTQCIEESVHVIFNESYLSCKKSNNDDQDREPLLVPGEVIDMANKKTDMMSQVKETSEDNAVSSSSAGEEPGTTITTTKVEERVVDVVQSTLQVAERRIQRNQSGLPSSSTNEAQVPNWKHKSSHPLDNIITPLNSGVQTRSKARNSLAFSTFLSQIEPKNIKESLKDADWITSMQDELHQFEWNNVWHLAPRPSDRTIIETRWVFRNKLDEHGNNTRNKARQKIDNTLFMKKRGRNLLIFQVYVDDIIFGKTTDSLCEEFAKFMGSEFEMSMMGYLVDRKNISRMAYFLGTCLISWGTRKLNSVALSTAEAEYVVAASCCAQVDTHDDYRSCRSTA
ncbi:uncharacterized protein LOC142168358 [Nicotiana tabacum]|uniref:Uncharacterized protein LOC142168358 n=1 Tax=Nicotiana tabacum TaxID=4097 RepID=A0AC58SJI9_TOBAC